MSPATAARPTRRVLVPASVDAAPPPLGGHLHEFGGRTMGSTWSVRLVAAMPLKREPVLRLTGVYYASGAPFSRTGPVTISAQLSAAST